MFDHSSPAWISWGPSLLSARLKVAPKTAVVILVLLVGAGSAASWVFGDRSWFPILSSSSSDAHRIVLDFAGCLDSAAESIASPGIGGTSVYGCELLYLSDRSRRGGLSTVSAANASAAADIRDLLRELELRLESDWDLLPMVGEETPPGSQRERLLHAASWLSQAADDVRAVAESIP